MKADTFFDTPLYHSIICLIFALLPAQRTGRDGRPHPCCAANRDTVKKIIRFIIRKVPRRYLQLFSHTGLKVVALFYKGNKVSCTICSHHFRKFLPYGRIVTRENALCPNCLSLERHRLMWYFLQKETNFFTAPLKVLHVAPEHCFINRFKQLDNIDYTTADIESPLADVKMDLHAIPFDANTFDVVFCNHVMEHVQNDIQCMKEIHRILRPGGWAIIQSPIEYDRETTYENASITRPSEREKHFGQSDHVRVYGRDYKARLTLAGFKVNESAIIKQFSQEEAYRLGLMEEELIYQCLKKA